MAQAAGGKMHAIWRDRITSPMIISFFSALICGILAHGFALFNKFSWHDDLFFMFSPGSTVTSGRWALHLLSWLEDLFFMDGHFSMPLYNGIIAILCVALSASLVVDLLKIRSGLLSGCLGCIMVAFPAITGIFAYNFTIHYYMFALLLMVAAAWLMCRGRHWWSWVLAIVLCSSGLGIYQALLSVVLFLLLMDAIMGLTEREEKISVLAKRILLQFLCLALIMALYFIANDLFLKKLNMTLYYPASETGNVTVPEYLARVGRAYAEFFNPVRYESWDMYPYRIHTMYYLMLAGDLLLSLRLLWLTARKRKGIALLLLVLLALIPLGCNFTFVLADHVHGLMTYGQVMQVAFFVFLFDRLELRLPRLRQLVSGVSAAVLAVTGLLYVRLANECYLKAEFQQQESISFFTTLITQIKSSEDYRADRPVLFVHEMSIIDPTVTDIREMDAIRTVSYQFTTLEYINNYTWAEFMELWCGFTPVYCRDRELEKMPEIQAMPRYPDAGSIQLVDDILVVNF